MRQTKAQRAVLKYLKEKHPNTFVALCGDIRNSNGHHYSSAVRSIDFVSLVSNNTQFLDIFGHVKSTIRLIYIKYGIQENVLCHECGLPVLLRSETHITRRRMREHVFCSQLCGVRNKDTRSRYSNNLIEKTGYANPKQDPDVNKRIEDNYESRTGFRNPRQNPDVIQVCREKSLSKTNGRFTHHSQNPNWQKQRRENYLEKTSGKYTHHTQDPLIFNKMQISQFKVEILTIEGKQFSLQGYEKHALLYMVRDKCISVDNILQCDEIDYLFEYKHPVKKCTSHYHPDFFIHSEDRVVEVKSTYTLCGQPTLWKTFQAKRGSVLRAGNKFSLILMKHNGERIKVPEHLLDESFSKIRSYLRKNNFYK